MTTINVYSFEELSEQAKQKALNENRHIDACYDWHNPILWQFGATLKSMGFESPDISFNGFYSQGDGASFTCSRIDLELFVRHFKCLTKYRILLDEDLEFEIYRSCHRYAHENSVSINHSYLLNDKDALIDDLCNRIEE